jgi:hypothetical protein
MQAQGGRRAPLPLLTALQNAVFPIPDSRMVSAADFSEWIPFSPALRYTESKKIASAKCPKQDVAV